MVFDNQLARWNRVRTFVALAGAFHGLGPSSVGEWETDGAFMTGLLAETGGGGGETPYGTNGPMTPEPAHNIRYFCGVARGDFIDNQSSGTGKLAGAINKDYDFGPADIGHEKTKESQVVFDDFLPYLNAVPPEGQRVAIVTDVPSGSYTAPHTVTVHVEPSDRSVDYVAERITTEFHNGFIVTSSSATLEGTLQDAQTLMLEGSGQWLVIFSAEGTPNVERTYWLDVERIEVEIITPNIAPFEGSLEVVADAPRGILYNSLKGDVWSEGPTVTITSDAAPRFIAIDKTDGVASEVVTKSFTKAPSTVTATVVQHYTNQRIGLPEYLAYGQQFGFTALITLSLVAGRWVLANPPEA